MNIRCPFHPFRTWLYLALIVNMVHVNFAVPGYHRVKLKESKKRDKYVDLVSKQKKLGTKH